MMVDLAGIELDGPSRSERSGNLPPKPERSEGPQERFGGPGRDRTDDLFHAMELQKV